MLLIDEIKLVKSRVTHKNYLFKIRQIYIYIKPSEFKWKVNNKIN